MSSENTDHLSTLSHNALRELAAEMLEVLETVRDDSGIQQDFAPIGTLNYASPLLKCIAKARGATQ